MRLEDAIDAVEDLEFEHRGVWTPEQTLAVQGVLMAARQLSHGVPCNNPQCRYLVAGPICTKCGCSQVGYVDQRDCRSAGGKPS